MLQFDVFIIKFHLKVTVLPEPVKAMPIISLPFSATGIPCTCSIIHVHHKQQHMSAAIASEAVPQYYKSSISTQKCHRIHRTT
jgi:hypothetical protein